MPSPSVQDDLRDMAHVLPWSQHSSILDGQLFAQFVTELCCLTAGFERYEVIAVFEEDPNSCSFGIFRHLVKRCICVSPAHGLQRFPSVTWRTRRIFPTCFQKDLSTNKEMHVCT